MELYYKNIEENGLKLYDNEYSKDLDNKYQQVYNKINEKLDDECKYLLNDLEDIILSMKTDSEQIGFDSGFKLANKIMIYSLKE